MWCERTALALAAATLLGLVPAAAAAREPAAAAQRRSSRAAVPNVPLRTHTGRAVRFYDDLVRDRLVLVSFMYTRCEGSCPLTLRKLLGVQRLLGEKLGKEVFILSITLDPEHDGPRVLREHAARLGARPGWEFLTGRPRDIEVLRRGLGFTDPDPVLDADRTQHVGMILLGNDRRARWSALPAGIPAEQIMETVMRVAGQVPAPLPDVCAVPPGPARAQAGGTSD